MRIVNARIALATARRALPVKISNINTVDNNIQVATILAI